MTNVQMQRKVFVSCEDGYEDNVAGLVWNNLVTAAKKPTSDSAAHISCQDVVKYVLKVEYALVQDGERTGLCKCGFIVTIGLFDM